MRDACRGAKLVSLEARRGVHPKGSAVAGLIGKKRLPTHKSIYIMMNIRTAYRQPAKRCIRRDTRDKMERIRQGNTGNPQQRQQ